VAGKGQGLRVGWLRWLVFGRRVLRCHVNFG